MNHEQAQANLQILLERIDALRRREVESIAERLHPDVVWTDVSGAVACEGRGQVLGWLRAAREQPSPVDALEVLADADHAVLGVRNHAREDLAGVQLNGQLFLVFTVREGPDSARRREHGDSLPGNRNGLCHSVWT
jgi:hypothetical protein